MDEKVETIHVYIVREDEAQQEQPVVESTITPASHPSAKTVPQPLVMQRHLGYARLVPLIILSGNIGVVIAVFFVHIYPILTATATITIIPKQAVVTEHLVLATVQSRIFAPVTRTQTKTVPATGKGHQDATAASGYLTLYNAAVTPQTIDAGTVLIGNNGVHIVTDQSAVIPGATPPTEGQTTITAHAVNTGAAGNIHAGDISGACCRDYVFAYNRAFHGGQDERDFSLVTQQDITAVISSVLPPLTKSIRTSLQQQVHAGEILTLIQCSQNTASDHQAGDEATTVTVTVSQSCLAGAYNPHDLQARVIQALSHQAARTLGGGYILSSYLQTSPIQASIHNRRVSIGAMYQATMIYHFSNQELHSISHQLAGKKKAEAIQLLSHLPGVAKIVVRMPGSQSHLPTDTTYIQVQVLVGNS